MNTKLKSAFIVSIILNVLLLGIFFGTLSPGFGRESSRRERLTAEIEKLPEPARSRFRDKMAQLRAADDPLRDQMRQARNQAIDLLVAEPLDEAAYDKQLIQISQLRGQISKRVADDLKELVRGLPPEQRAAVGEVLKRPAPPSR
ncbi:MAG TPA: periplasmic heavy metal sensor [Candidatus Binatia bacterium]|nr:periplasmic heavy metal sensor [Candidatus Binatia bacterium]